MSKRKIIFVVGTRPEFIKLAAIIPHLERDFNCKIINTNQHYDENMSDDFFRELNLKKPDWNLKISKNQKTIQISEMIAKCSVIFESQKPSMALVYGDTNSTLAGALTAQKLNVPVCHIEAGMRSYDKSMPEEINRIICDHISTLLMCPSKYAVMCLKKEGITKNVHLTGDIHFEIFTKAKRNPLITRRLKISKKKYFFATVHRQENTDNSKRLKAILNSFTMLNQPVVFAIHPRTQNHISKMEISLKNIIKIPPQNYASTIELIKSAKAVLTDSGGVQKEAYWAKVPCITLRPATEWVETLEQGWNHLVDTNEKLILKYCGDLTVPKSHKTLYGDGYASERIAKIIKKFLK